MIRTTQEFVQAFKAARRVSTPLGAVRTPDPAGTIDTILSVLNGSAEETPVLHWDIMRGLGGVNNAGKAEAQKVLGDGDPALVSARPSDALALARKLPENAALFFANAQRFVTDAVVVQGLWNLRDEFKSDGRMLVMLTTPGATLPPELAQDVLVLDEPLPSADDLRRIVTNTFGEVSLPEPTTEVVEKAVDALIGLAAFPAEQAVAMSLSRSGLDTPGLWERKRQVIEQTPGLSVWRGGETFDDIGGVVRVKDFLKAVIAGLLVRWVSEVQIRSRNAAECFAHAKDYDAVVTVRLANRDATFGLEYERTAKSEAHYPAIVGKFESEQKLDRFLYLTSSEDVLRFVSWQFRNCKRQVCFGLLTDWYVRLLDMVVFDWVRHEYRPLCTALAGGTLAGEVPVTACR